ncbi:MAG TPA: hypothetical protein DD977_11530, partial [Alcanivorax sp.]|nr:hypothetical protein [Alcanivorax sp.]
MRIVINSFLGLGATPARRQAQGGFFWGEGGGRNDNAPGGPGALCRTGGRSGQLLLAGVFLAAAFLRGALRAGVLRV